MELNNTEKYDSVFIFCSPSPYIPRGVGWGRGSAKSSPNSTIFVSDRKIVCICCWTNPASTILFQYLCILENLKFQHTVTTFYSVVTTSSLFQENHDEFKWHTIKGFDWRLTIMFTFPFSSYFFQLPLVHGYPCLLWLPFCCASHSMHTLLEMIQGTYSLFLIFLISTWEGSQIMFTSSLSLTSSSFNSSRLVKTNHGLWYHVTVT